MVIDLHYKMCEQTVVIQKNAAKQVSYLILSCLFGEFIKEIKCSKTISGKAEFMSHT